MGVFIFDGSFSAEFDDRTLAHLQLVIGSKLRRAESLHFSWHTEPSTASAARTILWIHPATSLRYEFANGQPPTINRLWIDELLESANSPGGLRIVPEPQDETLSAS
ncbi:MAG TPA: ATP-dependent DNA ligase [Glaciihabitans sp.]|nr:ATP-dependent DNA ligase [Glaciihabitans sp.]